MTLNYQSVTSPADGTAYVTCAAWSPYLGLWAAGGFPYNSSGKAMMTSPDGLNWTTRTISPLKVNGGTAENGAIADIAWAPALGLFCAVGKDQETGRTNSVWTSSDGITWTAQGNPNNNGRIAWSPALGLFVALGGQDTSSGIFGAMVQTSPDGVNWTTQTTPFDSTDRIGRQVTWSPSKSLFMAAFSVRPGNSTGIMTSPDGVTWTVRATPMDTDGVDFRAAIWNEVLGKFLVTDNGTGFEESASGTGGWSTHTSTVDLGSMGCAASGLIITPGSSSTVNQWAGSGNGTGQTLAGLTVAFQASGYSPDLDLVLLVGLDAGAPSIWASVPAPVTGAGSGACSTASLAGTLTPNTPAGDDVTWYFEWGTTTGYGNVTTGGTASGLSSVAVADTILGGLTPGVTYHYRLVAVHGAFTQYGADSTFVEDTCGSHPSLNAYVELGAP